MDNSTGEKISDVRPDPRRRFRQEKEGHPNATPCLDLLAHYGAQLAEVDGTIAVIRCSTGTELPLEEKGRLYVVKLLLNEFGTLAEANQAMGNYRARHS